MTRPGSRATVQPNKLFSSYFETRNNQVSGYALWYQITHFSVLVYSSRALGLNLE